MRIQGIVIKKIPFKEYDELVVCYTRQEGKQIYQARSIRRPRSKQASNLDVLHYVDFDAVPARGLPILISACALETFPQIHSSLPASGLAYLLLEICDRAVFENESDPKLWNFLVSTLHYLESATQDPQSDWRAIQNQLRGDLVQTLGYSRNTQLEEITQSYLHSARFFESVIQ